MAKTFGPGFTVDDVVEYLGFAAGVVIAGLIMVAFRGWQRDLWMMGACIVGGVVMGGVFHVVWKRLQQPPRPPMGPPPEDRPPMR